MNIFVDKKCWT